MKEEQGPSIVLEFDSISFEVGKKKTEARKKILDGITGRLESGQMVSVMGPSGAGKVSQVKARNRREVIIIKHRPANCIYACSFFRNDNDRLR